MRLHLFEFGDLSWFPSTLRDAMTAYLVAVYRMTPFPSLWAERIAPLLSKEAPNEIVDLASGAAGPLPRVIKQLTDRGFQVHATMTDLYPNARLLANAGPSVTYWPSSVDAKNVPPNLTGVLTMFTAFHHFRPEMAQQILRNAFDQRRPICIFEATSRAPGMILSAVLIPFLVLILTPSIRPLTWSQILFTYLIPILPLIIFWDGLVSHLRTYSVEELTQMTTELRSSEYQWTIEAIPVPGLPAKVPCLIGRLSA